MKTKRIISLLLVFVMVTALMPINMVFATGTETYTAMRFDANVPATASTTCTGSMEDQSFAYGEKKALIENAYFLPGYDFDGWNTKADGSGRSYADQEEVECTSDNGGTVTLYAQWSGKPYTIEYRSVPEEGSQKHVQTAYFDRPGKLDTYSDRAFGWYTGGMTLHGWSGGGLFIEDGDDFVNLCGAPDADGNVADPIIVADWVSNGKIVVSVTKDYVPQAGLKNSLKLVQGSIMYDTVPVSYRDGKYVFDPTSMIGSVEVGFEELPEGEYDILFEANGYPPASAHIIYENKHGASVVFDYYTITLEKDPAYSEFHSIGLGGDGLTSIESSPGLAGVARDGTMINIRTTVSEGYLFNGYTAVGVTPVWEGGDPTKANQTIEVQGKAVISAHVAPISLDLSQDADGNYLIASESDWNELARFTNAGGDTAGKVFLQTADISVTTMIGTAENPFKGAYDGGGKKLTFTYTATEAICAPFRYVDGASIEKLTVAGSITTAYKSAGGFVGNANACTITDCVSDVDIISNITVANEHGGFVATATNTRIEGCVYTGSITGTNPTYCAGFLNRGEAGCQCVNCIFAPDTFPTNNCANFCRWGSAPENCYYFTVLNSGRETGRQGYSVKGGDGVTLDFGAPTAEYSVSGVTAYATGLAYGSVFYAGEGETVGLTPAWSGGEAAFSASAGTLTQSGGAYTLTMPAGDVTITAAAATAALQLVDRSGAMPSAANIAGAQASSVYFGTYRQSSDGNGGYNVDPIKWRVLQNTAGHLFLLSDKNLDAQEYHVNLESVTWAESTVRSWLNGYDSWANKAGRYYSGDSFQGEAFSGTEYAAIADTYLYNDDNPSYGTEGGDDTTDKVFLLSIAEAQNTDFGFPDNYYETPIRQASNTDYAKDRGVYTYSSTGCGDWWLRSPGDEDYYAAIVNHFGYVDDVGCRVGDGDVAVRPAFSLNLNSVLFTSAAAGGKPSGAGLSAVSMTDAADWKLTLLDESRSGFAASYYSASGDVWTIKYGGAKTGENEYISAVIVNSSGAVTYYGRLCKAESGSDKTATVDLSGKMNEGDKLYIFNEQYNGDKKTDYASELQEIEKPTVTEYPLWVGDTRVTSDNLSGSGWSYEPDTYTLTLNNAVIDAGHIFNVNRKDKANIVVDQSGFDLTVNLISKNTLSGQERGICFIGGTLTVTGSGSLFADVSDCGIFVNGNLVIDSTTVDTGDIQATGLTITNSTVTAAGDLHVTARGMTVTNSTVKETRGRGNEIHGGLTVNGDCLIEFEGSYRALWSQGGVTLNDGNVLLEPVGGVWGDVGVGKTVYEADGTTFAKRVVFGEHIWNTEWSKDSTNHWHECTVCGAKKDEAPHNYAWTYVDDSTCKGVCVCGAEVTQEHYDRWATKCGRQPHCENCDHDYGTVPEHEMYYEYKNENGHKPNCYHCDTLFFLEAHSGGTATCTSKAVCEKCGHEYGEVDTDAHDWSAATYVWEADMSKVTAQRVCTRDASHIETETADATFEITKPATHTDEGEITYTAVFTNAAFETQTKKVPTPPDDRKWNVSFEMNGHGEQIDPQTVFNGEKAEKPDDPTSEAYSFGGWFTDKDCTNAYDFSTPVTDNLLLYAKWTKKPLLGDVDGDGIISIIDATYIQKHFASIPIPFEFNDRIADADEDGEPSVIDARFIQKWLASMKSNDHIGKPISV